MVIDKRLHINMMRQKLLLLTTFCWLSSKSSSFSCSDSIVEDETARKCLSPWPSINKSPKMNSFVQHDKVELVTTFKHVAAP